MIVTLGGQLERALGTFTALGLRWGLDPARLGVYTGLKLFLDNTNRSSLGIGLGAVQQIPILRASGQFAEARHLANVAYTTNTLTCLLYSALLVFWAWLRVANLADDPLAAEWTFGLIAVAGLALIKRYESFLVAILRAHEEFALTAELDVVESTASGIAVALGLWLAGFWGLLLAVAVVLLVKIGHAHRRHPLRFSWAWDLPLAWRMMLEGLPILANTAVFGALLSLDRVLILWRVPNGERAAGLYSIAIMGTSWSLDLAGRIVLVAYTAFQTTLGRTKDPAAVAKQAARAIEAQAPVLLAGSAVAYVIAPTFLGLLMPRYAEGLPALRPLLPGMVMLGLAWPARQMLIALGRPYTLCLATSVGLALTCLAGILGADRAGIVGVAWGMTIGGVAAYLLTSAAAFVLTLGLAAWLSHLARLLGTIALFAVMTLLSAHFPLGISRRDLEFCVRVALLTSVLLPVLWCWGRHHEWGGVFMRSS
jgi:O-antigen/teichoic acid export membrane protein